MRFDRSKILFVLLLGILLSTGQAGTQAPGRGRYCSVTDASGAWDFSWTGRGTFRSATHLKTSESAALSRNQ